MFYGREAVVGHAVQVSPGAGQTGSGRFWTEEAESAGQVRPLRLLREAEADHPDRAGPDRDLPRLDFTS